MKKLFENWRKHLNEEIEDDAPEKVKRAYNEEKKKIMREIFNKELMLLIKKLKLSNIKQIKKEISNSGMEMVWYKTSPENVKKVHELADKLGFVRTEQDRDKMIMINDKGFYIIHSDDEIKIVGPAVVDKKGQAVWYKWMVELPEIKELEAKYYTWN